MRSGVINFSIVFPECCIPSFTSWPVSKAYMVFRISSAPGFCFSGFLLLRVSWIKISFFMIRLLQGQKLWYKIFQYKILKCPKLQYKKLQCQRFIRLAHIINCLNYLFDYYVLLQLFIFKAG